MQTRTYKIALGGILSGLTLALMFFGTMLPFATYAAPAVASAAIAIIQQEQSPRFAVGVYLTVGLLSAFISPDREAALLFLGFFGHYPMTKLLLERRFPRPVAAVLKGLVFIVCVGGIYGALLWLLTVEAVRQELLGMPAGLLALVAALGLLTFYLLDICLTRIVAVYVYKIRPRFLRRSGRR